MAIGTAIFAIFLILLFVHNPEFRKFVLSTFALVMIIAIILLINASIPEQTRPIYFGQRPHAAHSATQNATYRPTSEGPMPVTMATPAQPDSPAPSPPVRDKFVAGDEQHCPAGYAWDWQNRSCCLES
jgi:hypothetical protein